MRRLRAGLEFEVQRQAQEDAVKASVQVLAEMKSTVEKLNRATQRKEDW